MSSLVALLAKPYYTQNINLYCSMLIPAREQI